eukprot:TRINITY_DN969_c0_g1_i1.p1 TRINITY_DN969_c0_g1~~TRINITY_DN969_c0_g1_i1.p1  ORF type:complete len:667 (+),score=81.63 TRINITY_DN969_c0_g1_i1:123-2003(+)
MLLLLVAAALPTAAQPTVGPSRGPSAGPSGSPSASPSASPVARQNAPPSASPSMSPSASPVAGQAPSPSASPSASPVAGQGPSPSASPSASPVAGQGSSPTAAPAAAPPANPTAAPALPGAAPSSSPSAPPNVSPSRPPLPPGQFHPSWGPSASPSQSPAGPSASPATQPSASPLVPPSLSPLPPGSPTRSPAAGPTTSPGSGAGVPPSRSPVVGVPGAPSRSPAPPFPPPPPVSPVALPPPPPPGTPAGTPPGTPGAPATSPPTAPAPGQTPPPTVQLLYPPAVPPSRQLLRLTVSVTVQTFNKDSFVQNLLKLLWAVGSPSRAVVAYVVIHWVCPQDACPGGLCHSKDEDRISFGCRRGSDYQGRALHALAEHGRLGHGLQEGVYVDAEPLPASGQTADSALAAATTAVSNAISSSDPTATAAALTAAAPASGWQDTGATPPPATTAPTGQLSAADDDGSLEAWHIVLIVLGCLLICAVLVAAVLYCVTRPDPYLKAMQKKKEQEQDLDRGFDEQSSNSRDMPQPPLHPEGPVAGQLGPHASQQQLGNGFQGNQGNGHAGEDPDALAPYPVGTQVEVLYEDGVHYKGEVAEDQGNGFYAINWDDGSHSFGVARERMRLKANRVD